MKRQRSVLDGAGNKAAKADGAATLGKKGKRAAEVIKEEDLKNGREAAGIMVENVMGWDEWPWLSGAADEQMSWGFVWSPLWDVDFVDKAYNLLFSDVVWDDDIWNLKSIQEIPKP